MSRFRRASLVIAATAAAAIIIVIVADPLRPDGGVRPTASPEDASPPQVAPVDVRLVEWQRLDDAFAITDPTPLRVHGLVGGNGLIVGWGRVGAEGRNQFNDMGAVFVSGDGLRWRSIPLQAGVGPLDTSEPNGVAIGPLGVLAYGGVCCAVEQRAMWRSLDGVQWLRVPLEGDLRRDSWFNRVVGIPDGWVAVGSSGTDAAIWHSLDGQTWHAVDRESAGFGAGTVSDVALVGGRLVAVGTVDDAAGTHDGGVWTSDDGVAWARAAEGDPNLIGPDETELWRVLPLAGGMFVVGNHGPHEERVRCEELLGAVASLKVEPPPLTALSCGWGREHHWLSADATAWERLPPLDPLPGQPAALGIRPLEFRLLGGKGAGLLNLAEDSEPPDGDVGLWASADGATWARLEKFGQLQPNAVVTGLVVIGDSLIAIGEGKADEGYRPVVWIGRFR